MLVSQSSLMAQDPTCWFWNARLLAVSPSCADAAQVALDFVNWDLEAAGMTWRLSLNAD